MGEVGTVKVFLLNISCTNIKLFYKWVAQIINIKNLIFFENFPHKCKCACQGRALPFLSSIYYGLKPWCVPLPLIKT